MDQGDRQLTQYLSQVTKHIISPIDRGQSYPSPSLHIPIDRDQAISAHLSPSGT